MSRASLHLGTHGADEAAELSITHALLRLASDGELDEAVRVYLPRRSTVVFGRRDTRLPGYDAAVAAARSAGFDTAVRVVGGRAVAYTANAVVVDHVRHDPRAVETMDARFQSFGEQYAALLAGEGVDAHVGPVPGEYCPGEHSVNARSAVKLVGTAQRVVRHAWLFSALVVVDDLEPVREVLTEVYGRLDLPFLPGSVGSVRAEAPHLDTDAVLDLIVGLAGGETSAGLPPGVLDRASSLVDQHR
ncbi:biotin/lipoate A/B protein ligase family protein [Nocardioides aestuarii]|uniref:Lipoate--protein ligase family protein n=1 Tax=Nocardioides aestuarii TaxID=252231 RepID=A0ABW4TM27_9ACTN